MKYVCINRISDAKMSAMMPAAAVATVECYFPRHVDDIYEEFTAAVFFFLKYC